MRIIQPLVYAYLWWRGRRAPAYRQRWSERAAKQDVPPQFRDGIIIHCVSVGETIAARGLIEKLAARYPQQAIIITSMTPTATDIVNNMFANSRFSDRLHTCYLPFDTPAAMRRFFNKFAPRLVLLLETELWPVLLATAQQRNVPVMLLNARLSAKSALSYKKYAWLLGPVWQQLAKVCAQTESTYNRLQALGVPEQKLQLVGNLKFDIQLSDDVETEASKWRNHCSRPVICAGSTHAGEDEVILQGFRALLTKVPDALLVLVPRHPERFQPVATLIQQQGLRFITRSSGQQPEPTTQVLLGDTMGELVFWYAAAEIAFIGGSLIARGGHNPIEAVSAGTPVMSGPHVFNFEAVFERLQQQQAIRWAKDAHELAAQWESLLTDKAQCADMVARGKQAFALDTGATIKTLAAIEGCLQPVETENHTRTITMIKTLKQDSTEIWYDADYAAETTPEFDATYFDPEYWSQKGLISGTASGRSKAWFIDQQPESWLLRHYYRGGLVGKVNADRFAREPIAQSRAMAEFELLLKLRELELPVPKPIAAKYSKAPWWGYRADIIVAVIPNAQDVFHILLERAILADTWRAIGAAIKGLHQQRVYHSDLNCHNLMLDGDNKVWIVDFDKCGFKEAGLWQQENLQRLKRSLLKEQGKCQQQDKDFHWHETDWQALIEGYEKAQ